MMLTYLDKRLTPPRDIEPIPAAICVPRLPLFNAPITDERVRQVTTALYGEAVEIYNQEDGFAYIRLTDDHYMGWVRAEGLQAPSSRPATHHLSAAMSFGFRDADIKSGIQTHLYLNSRLILEEERGPLAYCQGLGWVPRCHLTPVNEYYEDPCAIAENFIATPYLWGGNDASGVDCSGLIQIAFKACGLQLPRDSDMQFAWSGNVVPDWQNADKLRRNDLVFWQGHVGILQDASTLLHANATHMAVSCEPLQDAIERIQDTYSLPLGVKRLALDGLNSKPWKG